MYQTSPVFQLLILGLWNTFRKNNYRRKSFIYMESTLLICILNSALQTYYTLDVKIHCLFLNIYIYIYIYIYMLCISKTVCFSANCAPFSLQFGWNEELKGLNGSRPSECSNRTPPSNRTRPHFGAQSLSQSEAFPPLSL